MYLVFFKYWEKEEKKNRENRQFLKIEFSFYTMHICNQIHLSCQIVIYSYMKVLCFRHLDRLPFLRTQGTHCTMGCQTVLRVL